MFKVKMCLVTQLCLTPLQPHAKAHQALSMGFSRQEYWSGLPFLLLLQGIFPACVSCTHALTGRLFTAKPPGKPKVETKIQYFFSLKNKKQNKQTKNNPPRYFSCDSNLTYVLTCIISSLIFDLVALCWGSDIKLLQVIQVCFLISSGHV